MFCMSFSLHNFLALIIFPFYLYWHHWEIMAVLKHKLVLELPLACARSHWQPKPTRPVTSLCLCLYCRRNTRSLTLQCKWPQGYIAGLSFYPLRAFHFLLCWVLNRIHCQLNTVEWNTMEKDSDKGNITQAEIDPKSFWPGVMNST